MTIEEAIKHCREKANALRKESNSYNPNKGRNACIKCAEEHEQLAEWLEELKGLREKMTTEKAIEIIKTELECVNRQSINCDRDCKNCDLLRPTEDVIDGMELAIEVLEKNNPKPYIVRHCQSRTFKDSNTGDIVQVFTYHCPTCGEELGDSDWDGEPNNNWREYCDMCGQRIDWASCVKKPEYEPATEANCIMHDTCDCQEFGKDIERIKSEYYSLVSDGKDHNDAMIIALYKEIKAQCAEIQNSGNKMNEEVERL